MKPRQPRSSLAHVLFIAVGVSGVVGCPPPAPVPDTSGGSDASGSGGLGSGGSGSGGFQGSGGQASGGTHATGGATVSSGGSSGSGGSGSGGSNSGGSSSGGSASGGNQGSGGGGSGGAVGGKGSGGQSASGGTAGGRGGQAASGTGGMTGSGGAAPVMCTPPTGGTQGYTTRFWDCCKPSCAWPQNAGGKSPARTCSKQNQTVGSGNQSACSNGDAYACWDMAPWAESATKAYAYAAFNGGGCGTCYELKFTGKSNGGNADDPGAQGLCGKTLVVQVINIGNIAQGQFDLMIPGGGVGDFNACSNQWSVSGTALGERYGGVMLTCQKQNNEITARKSCTANSCSTLFSSSNLSTLKAGCEWTVDWLNAADNPKVVYQQVACPNELTSKSGLR